MCLFSYLIGQIAFHRLVVSSYFFVASACVGFPFFGFEGFTKTLLSIFCAFPPPHTTLAFILSQ